MEYNKYAVYQCVINGSLLCKALASLIIIRVITSLAFLEQISSNEPK